MSNLPSNPAVPPWRACNELPVGRLVEVVEPVTKLFWLASTAIARPESSPLPPTYFDQISDLPAVASLATNASVAPPPNVVGVPPGVTTMGKSEEEVEPVT